MLSATPGDMDMATVGYVKNGLVNGFDEGDVLSVHATAATPPVKSFAKSNVWSSVAAPAE